VLVQAPHSSTPGHGVRHLGKKAMVTPLVFQDEADEVLRPLVRGGAGQFLVRGQELSLLSTVPGQELDQVADVDAGSGRPQAHQRVVKSGLHAVTFSRATPLPGGRYRAVVVREQNLGLDRPAEVDEVGCHVDEEVVDRDHADELPTAYDGQPADGMGPQQRERAVQVGVGVNGDDRRTHDPVDPGISWQALSQAPPNEVAVGDDADETVTVDDGEGADPGLFHDRRRVVDRPLWLDAQA